MISGTIAASLKEPMIRANCRDRFTAEDFTFIVRVLGKSRADSVSLTALLSDQDTRDSILDHELLFQAILSETAQLTISPQLYFYILTRHVLKESGLPDRRLCDYIASLLETFSRSARLKSPAAPGDQLYVGIYYSRWLIDQLEQNDPRRGISDSNIRALIAFVEEINHALHAALKFKEGSREIHSEDFARNLEVQALVDTYLVLILFVAFFRKSQRISRTDRRWLRFHLFSATDPAAYSDPNLRGRYLETTQLAARYTRYLDTLNGLRRVDEIRKFHSLCFEEKKHLILALPER